MGTQRVFPLDHRLGLEHHLGDEVELYALRVGHGHLAGLVLTQLFGGHVAMTFGVTGHVHLFDAGSGELTALEHADGAVESAFGGGHVTGDQQHLGHAGRGEALGDLAHFGHVFDAARRHVRHSGKASGVNGSRGSSQLVKGLVGEQRNEDVGAGRQQRCGFGQVADVFTGHLDRGVGQQGVDVCEFGSR